MEIKNTSGVMPLHRNRPIANMSQKKELSPLDHERTRLRKATREFESFFLASMLKSMRATVPKAEGDSKIPGGGLGKELYQDMFDTELSKKMAERSKGGIGDILYQTLVGRIESESITDSRAVSPSETTVAGDVRKDQNDK